MRAFGLKIGETGVEFSTQKDREQALLVFTKGSTVKIGTGSGPVYEGGATSFGTYERETNETLLRCEQCKAVHSSQSCVNREFPKKNSWDSDFKTEHGFICDGCFAAQTQAKAVFDAKKLLKTE
jgi:hypothetical protein